jgi:hypothetical protein
MSLEEVQGVIVRDVGRTHGRTDSQNPGGREFQGKLGLLIMSNLISLEIKEMGA